MLAPWSLRLVTHSWYPTSDQKVSIRTPALLYLQATRELTRKKLAVEAFRRWS